MDDVETFGQLFSTSVPFSKAVELGRIVPIRLHLVDINDQTLRNLFDGDEKINIVSSKDNVELGTEGQKYLALASIAARKVWGDLVRNGDSRKAIAFMGRTADCARAIDVNHPLSLVQDSGVATYEYHSGISIKKRKKLRNQFADHKGPALMTAVRAIREGVSINDVDTVILLRGYGSDDEQGISTELVQHIGRAVRTASGKTHANVIVPIPSIGVADKVRQRVLQMIVTLMEEFNILAELVNVMAVTGRATVGTLRKVGIMISPPMVSLAEEDILSAIENVVLDFTKQYNSHAYESITDAQFDAMVDEIAEMDM